METVKTFERTKYGKEHKLVVLTNQNKRPSIKNCEVRDFNEEFQHFLEMTSKKFWANLSGFLLEYNSKLSDLQNAYYLYPQTEEVENEIRKKLKVIEVN